MVDTAEKEHLVDALVAGLQGLLDGVDRVRRGRPSGAAVRLPVDDGEGPTPQQREKFKYKWVNPAEIDSKEQKIGRAMRNVSAPLDRWLARRQISKLQWQAGDKLREDWHRAGYNVSVSAPYDGVRVDRNVAHGLPMTEAQVRARQRLRNVFRNMGVRLAGVAVAVAIYEKGAGEIGRWARRQGKRQAEIAGMSLVIITLDALVDAYGL